MKQELGNSLLRKMELAQNKILPKLNVYREDDVDPLEYQVHPIFDLQT